MYGTFELGELLNISDKTLTALDLQRILDRYSDVRFLEACCIRDSSVCPSVLCVCYRSRSMIITTRRWTGGHWVYSSTRCCVDR